MQSIFSAVVRTLVLYSLAEAQLGHAKNIHINVNEQSFSVEDDGRGHAIDRTIECAPYLQFIYTHLDYPFEEPKFKPVQLQGLGMSLLNSLCKRLSVQVQKSGASLELEFQHGKLIRHEYSEAQSSQTGNKISGEVSRTASVAIGELEKLEVWLISVAETMPSLQLYFNNHFLHPRSQSAA